MLILANLSGIQDYLFEVRETGGKQARSLRFRSLYIQLIAEAVGVRLLHAAGMSDDSLIYCAAGKIAIHGAVISQEKRNALYQEVREIEHWLRDKTHARLRLCVTIHDQPGMTIRDQVDAAGHDLQRAKLRSWKETAGPNQKWQPTQLLTTSPLDAEKESSRDADLGKQIVQSNIRHVVFARVNGDGFDTAGLSTRLMTSVPSALNGVSVRSMNRLSRHVPIDANGHAIEFLELAKKHSRGAAMLGVLKADADSLGAAIASRLAGASDLLPLKDLSQRLETFFASHLDEQMSASGSSWSKLYTVFSGGDDLLLVGPWNIVLEFAGHLHQQFTQQFQKDQLTISAGVAIVKPKFPIHLAAQQADDLLDHAKLNKAPRAIAPKDQCAALGGLWKWKDHQRIIDAGKRLAQWVDNDGQNGVQRGWLHTLLQLTLLRRGELPGTTQHEQVVATARLSYHIARNWPKNSPARQWVDTILRDFDQYESTSHPESLHLPAILRYAMLATRSQGDPE